MNSSIRDSDIAIIGMSCRFPGANNLAMFWKNLCEGVESITFFDKNKLVPENSDNDINHVNAGAILDDIELFDPNFFNFSSREAEIADPQQRVFLECSWEALEDAGCNPHTYKGSIGVYAGVGLNTYLINNILTSGGFERHKNFLGSMMNMRIMIGNDKDYLPTLVSYKFNLRGPSVNVQTACSTSLVAVHLACQSLLNGECDMALAGASHIIVPQKAGYYYQEGMAFSPDGHCRTFDAEAQGTVFGSGVGVIVLKSLEKAVEEGDSIYAVIKGTAINNDGGLKVGYTAPSVEGQSAVIKEALAVSEVDSETITYVEAHGTATPLGDPIEVDALTQAFNSDKKCFCAIGSVKTNFGHLGWTAGMAGLIKTVLSLRYKQLPPSLHFKNPNPRIDFDNSPFYVNTELRAWTTNGIPRRAGVSAFGFGGTNAHLIIEEAPDKIPAEKNTPKLPHHILTLSAKTQQGLIDLAKRYKEFFNVSKNDEIQTICFTTNTGRNHFNHRLAIITSSCNDAFDKLNNYELKNRYPAVIEGPEELFLLKNKKTAFLFTGNGSHHFGMGRQLYETQPVFRKTMDECNALFKQEKNLDLLEIIYSMDSKNSRINVIEFSQPALYSLQIALANVWNSWGVKPDFVIGRDVGEVAAAYTAGVFSLETGLRIAIQQGVLKKALSEGKKINSMLQEFKKILEDVSFKSSHTNIISDRTGLLIDTEITSPDHWYQHSQVISKFNVGLESLKSSGVNCFIEIGPKQEFLEIVRQSFSACKITYVPSLSENKNDWEQLLTSVGELYVCGYSINWDQFHKSYDRKIVHLPTYPFQRQRYWVGDSEVIDELSE